MLVEATNIQNMTPVVKNFETEVLFFLAAPVALLFKKDLKTNDTGQIYVMKVTKRNFGALLQSKRNGNRSFEPQSVVLFQLLLLEDIMSLTHPQLFQSSISKS